MTLPTTKNTPGQNPLNKKTLLYADYKVGKSTLVSKLYPNAIFIAADPTGLEELPVFRVPGERGLKDWNEFRRIGGEIAELREQEDFPYDAICIDTAGELVRLCSAHVLGQLTGGPVNKDFIHASDWEYGKAWNAITEEFRLRVGKLCSLGLPVVFIAHAKSTKVQKKTRTGQKLPEITVFQPDIPGGSGQWLQGFVDYIFYAEVIEADDGERRVLRTTPSETYLAGARQPEGRIPLPETLPLDGERLRKALEATAVAPDTEGIEVVEATTEPEVLPQSSPNAPVRSNGKREPAKVKTARLIVEAIDEERVKNSGYTGEEAKALQTIANYEAKQKEST